MLKVGIIGSCVTRDAFEVTNNVYDVKGAYFPRASLISLMSKEVEPSPTLINIEKQWVKWVLNNDYNKSTLQQLKSISPDLICIDLIDERYDLVSINDSYLTRSDELVKYIVDVNNVSIEKILKMGCAETEAIFFEKAVCFCEKINNLFPGVLVVIHEARYSDYYLENGNIQKFSEERRFLNALTNARLNIYYELLKEKIKNSISIRLDEQYVVSCKEHKWGLSPFHYINDYYVEFINKLNTISIK